MRSKLISIQNIYNLFEPIILIILIVGVALINSKDYVFGNQMSKFFLFHKALTIFLVIRFISFLFNKRPLHFKITRLDIVLSVFFLYATFNRFIVSHTFGYTLQYYELLGLATLYILLRSSSKSNTIYLYCLLMISGVVQAIYGNLQFFGIFPSNHLAFTITGSFFNPGPYAGYLIPIFAIAIAFSFFSLKLNEIPFRFSSVNNERQDRFVKLENILNKVIQQLFNQLPFIAAIAIILVLPVSRSRAAWLAAIISTIWIVAKKYNFRNYYDIYFNTYFKRIIFGCICMGVILGSTILIYHLGKSSADGRLLIWKVTGQMIKDKPVFGQGYEKFAANYMNYQAKYFAENPNTGEDVVADENRFAFNESLRIVSELGFVGLFILAGLLYLVFNVNKWKKIDETDKILLLSAQAGILSIFIFSLFSYPNVILPIKITFVLFLSVISGFSNPVTEKSWNIGWLMKTIITPVVFIGVTLSYSYIRRLQTAQHNWLNAYSIYQAKDYQASVILYKEALPMLKNDGDFLLNYGKALSMAGKNEQAIKVFSIAKNHLTNTIIYTSLGDSYKAMGKINDAEQAYFYAWQMIPSRFYPKYLLAKLYDETGQKQKAINVAKELLNKEVKIESTAIKEMQLEMKIIINEGIKE